MTDTLKIKIDTKINSRIKKIPFNWSIVGLLFFMTGIPSIPAIFLLILVAVGLIAGDHTSSIINLLHFETPAAIFVHGGAGILFFFSMPFQFSPAIRSRRPNLHKKLGRIALTSGYVMCLSGIWMHHVLFPELFSTGIDARYVSLVVTSLAMCVAFSLALFNIIKGNIQLHRKWMSRAVAITLAVVTVLFVDGILFLLFGQFESFFAEISQFQHDFGRLVGIAINLIIVECVFLKEQRKYKA